MTETLGTKFVPNFFTNFPRHAAPVASSIPFRFEILGTARLGPARFVQLIARGYGPIVI
jgi:hypothetical protein